MDFRKIGDLLRGTALPETFRSRLKEAEAVSRWEIAVGPTIAKYAQAIRVEAGVLHVEVGHPMWRSELHHRRRQILEILNSGVTSEDAVLKDLHFVDPKRLYATLKSQNSSTAQNQAGALPKKSKSRDPGPG